MKLNLVDLAKQADEAYVDVACTFGPVRVYHVPVALLLSASRSDKPEPEIPVVRMKTATGYQNRNAKKGDRQFDEYQKDLAAYNNHVLELQNAAGLVLALKDIDWTEYDITQPPPSKRAEEMYNGNWPEDELLRKRAWLNWTVMFHGSDSKAIFEALARLRGESEPDEDMVDEVKKNSA